MTKKNYFDILNLFNTLSENFVFPLIVSISLNKTFLPTKVIFN